MSARTDSISSFSHSPFTLDSSVSAFLLYLVISDKRMRCVRLLAAADLERPALLIFMLSEFCTLNSQNSVWRRPRAILSSMLCIWFSPSLLLVYFFFHLCKIKAISRSNFKNDLSFSLKWKVRTMPCNYYITTKNHLNTFFFQNVCICFTSKQMSLPLSESLFSDKCCGLFWVII